MSKFTKALEQAQRDRALRGQPTAPPAPPPAPPPSSAPAASFYSTVPPPAPVAPPLPRAPRRIPMPPRRAAVPVAEVDSHLVSLVAPAGLEAEQYRALRHLVEQRRKADNLSVIAVSSPGAGDGKTTTAINLAGALAQAADASVLLVEADLRRPSIGRLLGFGDSDGLGLVDAILDPKLTLGDIVQVRPPYNLSVVLAGQTPPSPYEVLKSPRLGELLDEARQRFDYVVMDTTPLVPVQDCRVVARWVDGVVVVVAADHTPRALLEAALDVLDQSKVIGLIFNGYDYLLTRRYSQYAASYVTATASPPRSRGFGRISRRIGSLLRRPGSDGGGGRRARERSR